MAARGDPKLICRILVQKIPEIERKREIRIPMEHVEELIDFCLSRSYGRYSVERAIDLLSEGMSPSDIESGNFLEPLSESEITDLLDSINDKKNISAISRKMVEITKRPVDNSLIARAIEKLSRK